MSVSPRPARGRVCRRVRAARRRVLSWALVVLCFTSWAHAEPPRPQSTRARSPAKAPSVLPPAIARARRLGLGHIKSAGKLLQGRPETAWVTEAGPRGWNGTLRFPVTGGHVTRGFGSGKGGYHQAVDIAAEPGTKIRAAAGGMVGYAGSQVSGYGNLILLIHPNGFVTVYAHNRKNLVVVGQRIARNAVIAELGSTGLSKGPHVHFELLWNGQNCDPMPLFRPAALRRDGSPAGSSQSAWKVPHKKPKSVRCGPRKHHPDYVRKGSATDVDDDNERDEPAAP